MVEQTQILVGSNAWLAALEQQAACYRRLARLVESQHEHVAQGRVDALIAVLDARGAEVTQITAIERTLGDSRKNWATLAPTLPVAVRESAETLFGEMRNLLATITAADRDDTIILQQRKLDVGQQLKQTTAARGINRSYAAAAYGKPVPRMDVRQ